VLTCRAVGAAEPSIPHPLHLGNEERARVLESVAPPWLSEGRVSAYGAILTVAALAGCDRHLQGVYDELDPQCVAIDQPAILRLEAAPRIKPGIRRLL